jgi:ubiquinone/menaquinone biosynthesis C-methylase UbiE
MKPNPPDFDSVARVYRWAEYASLGRFLERTRTHFLPELHPCKRAMVLGDGDGRFLARWMAQDIELKAMALDTSAKMLDLLRKNCARAPNAAARLTLVKASALEMLPENETDIVVSHFFLDCLTQDEADTLVKNYAARLRPGTLWVVSDFALPHSAWLRPLAATYIRMLYLAFRVLTGLRVTRLPDVAHAMERAGFAQKARKEWLGGLIYTEIWVLG